jgi:hypothetical protein
MFDRVQVRALAGPLLRCFGCVLRVVVLLEGEASPQSEVLSAREQGFIKDLSVLCSIHLCLDQSLSVPAAENATTTMLHRRDGARFLPDVTLDILA